MPHSIQQFTKLKQKPFTTVTARICLHLTQTQSDTVAAHTQKQGYHNYYSVVCLTTGSKPPPKRFLHIVRSKASSFKWEYPLLSLRSSSNFLRLLPRLLVTSISPFIFPSITCFRRQFLRKMWPIQLAFRFLIAFRIFLCSLTLWYILQCQKIIRLGVFTARYELNI